ncbi:MAG: YfcC family protein [Sumerlaeia bacterium]
MSIQPKQEEKPVKSLSTLALLFLFLLAASIATQVLPKGEFERVEKEIVSTSKGVEEITVTENTTVETLLEEYKKRLVDGKTDVFSQEGQPLTGTIEAGTVVNMTLYKMTSRSVVDATTFATIPRPEDLSLLDRIQSSVIAILQAPMEGFNKQKEIIAFILIIGGAFGMIMSTGAIDEGLGFVVKSLENTPFQWVVIPVIMFAFSLGGAVFGLSEEVIPFVMITIPLAIRLGYDSIVGLCMSFVGAGIGFATAFLNPFTIGIAQGIAEITPFSGMEYRIAIWLVISTVGASYVLFYASKIKKNPALSPVHEHDKYLAKKFNISEVKEVNFSTPHVLVLLILTLAIGVIAWGVKEKSWWMTELSAVFFAAGILSAVVTRTSLSVAANNFMKGATGLADAALIVAISGGIVSVMEQGQILDTILNAIASALDGTHGAVCAVLMFFFQTGLNFFVPSGSGQAAMTMPIMAPLADLIGISRQTSVLAFQFGDGFGNMIIPTSAVTMSVLSIAEIPWSKWARWLLPLELIFVVLGSLFLVTAVLINY